MRTELPTGTVTFLFTDIEGSTRLLEELGPDAYGPALAEHRRALRVAFTAHDGVEVDTQGDAFFVAFPTAQGAAKAALEAQRALASGRVSVRIGLHTGTPTVTSEGYVGVDVHRAARVAALAHGRQILLSPATAALLDGETVVELGLHRLKDFQGTTRLYQLGTDRFPPLRSPGSVDLPVPATRFLGREHELFDAVSLVHEHDPRVLTVVGPGGTGKTRFAIELCRLLADEAEGGTVFVALAPLRDAGLVLGRIADRLGAAPDTDAIADRIADKRTHVLVDNVEHLLPTAARDLADLVAATPALRLVATSREALRIHGEHQFDLLPLTDREAIALFCARAKAVRPDVGPTETVQRLCERLDRLPLALELAAARTKLLTPDQLLDRLGDRLDLLKGTLDVDERHSTLRATIAWSYDLLEPDEERLFARMSVFAAGATLESAEAVCDADLDVLSSLLDKSLLRRRTGRLREVRCWMLETIKEFAHERLEESGTADAIRRRHAVRMLEIARSAALSENDDMPPNLEIALAERDDLRAALDWGAEHDLQLTLELAVALENFWNAHAPSEGARRLVPLLDRATAAPKHLRATALRALGGALDLTGAREDGRRRYEESLALSREIGDERGIASATHRLAMGAVVNGDVRRAQRLAEESLRLSRGRFLMIDVPNYSVLGQALFQEGRYEEGMELVRKSADLAARVGWEWWRCGQLDILAHMAIERGEIDAADRDGSDALRIMRAQENRHWALYTMTTLARVAVERQQLEHAGVIWGAVEGETRRSHDSGWKASRSRYGGNLPSETRPEFAAGREHGLDLDLWDAVAIALGEVDAGQTEP